MTDVTGGDNGLYDFPEGTTCFADLADHMGFNRACILKSVLRWGEKNGTTLEYDLQKIIWYAERELWDAECTGGEVGENVREDFDNGWIRFGSSELEDWERPLDMSGMPGSQTTKEEE